MHHHDRRLTVLLMEKYPQRIRLRVGQGRGALRASWARFQAPTEGDSNGPGWLSRSPDWDGDVENRCRSVRIMAKLDIDMYSQNAAGLGGQSLASKPYGGIEEMSERQRGGSKSWNSCRHSKDPSDCCRTLKRQWWLA